MFGVFARKESNYTCLFWADGVRRQTAESLPPDIELQVGVPERIVPDTSTERFYRNATKFQVFLGVKTAAVDAEAAWRMADQRLGEVFAGLNLFDIDKRFRVRTSGSLVTDDAGAEEIVGHRRLGSGYLGSYDSRHMRSEMLFRVLGKAGKQDEAQLSAAIQYHRLALQATSDEARILNLWIALEALCPRMTKEPLSIGSAL